MKISERITMGIATLALVASVFTAYFQFLHKPNEFVAIVDPITLKATEDEETDKVEFLLTIPITFINSGKQPDSITRVDLVMDGNILGTLEAFTLYPEKIQSKSFNIDLNNYLINVQHFNMVEPLYLEEEIQSLEKEIQSLEKYIQSLENEIQSHEMEIYSIEIELQYGKEMLGEKGIQSLEDKIQSHKKKIQYLEKYIQSHKKKRIQSHENILAFHNTHNFVRLLALNQLVFKFVTVTSSGLRNELEYPITGGITNQDIKKLWDNKLNHIKKTPFQTHTYYILNLLKSEIIEEGETTEIALKIREMEKVLGDSEKEGKEL